MIQAMSVGAGGQAAGAGAAQARSGRRERKKQATRAAIRGTALRLATQHGVENVTVEQIAHEADIALRTFFNYFSSKEEAVMAAASSGLESLIAEFRARPRTESVLEAFREAVLTVMNRSEAGSGDYIGALRLVRREPSLVPQQLAVLAAQEQALGEAIAERIGGHPGPLPGGVATQRTADDHRHDRTGDSAYPELCAAALLAALRVVLDRWLDLTTGSSQTPSTDELRRQFDEAIAELAAGLDRPGPAST